MLAPGYPLYGIGGGIGASPQASPLSNLRGSFGVKLRDRLMGSKRGRLGGSIRDWLRISLGCSLVVSLRGDVGSRLKSSLQTKTLSLDGSGKVRVKIPN